MGLFDKLKEILFDEETVEIPVITKESQSESKVANRPKVKTDDEVKIKKISPIKEDEDLFDMPKLKEEAKEEVRTSTFTFPVFDDEDLDIKDESRTNKKREERKEERKEPVKKSTGERKYDYLSSTSYRVKKETPKDTHYTSYSSTTKVEEKPFKLSPIISPVYGILNENYKKEDIVTKSEVSSRLSSEKLDLDSVRKKAYGTLEDEIEESLTKKPVKEEKVKSKDSSEEITLDDLSDDGLSISDLLVDKDEKKNNETEIFDVADDEVAEEIELDDDASENSKSDEKKEAIGEEDLFDLIDSLYAGKGDN